MEVTGISGATYIMESPKGEMIGPGTARLTTAASADLEIQTRYGVARGRFSSFVYRTIQEVNGLKVTQYGGVGYKGKNGEFLGPVCFPPVSVVI
jgi:hypothetical protein